MHRFFTIFISFVVALMVQLCGGVHIEDLYNNTVDLQSVLTVDSENNGFGQNRMDKADEEDRHGNHTVFPRNSVDGRYIAGNRYVEPNRSLAQRYFQ